ncbi:MAG: type II toxin-antitoxin system RelE/ParE family toxin [SAR324 cluster bacterium]|nr:type II toxin-antitoxin system RelE/ParE family toxin [SAR324 cluster bacterium]
MNEKYEIIWSEVAENDLKRIVEYIAIDNLENGLKVLKKIRTKTSTLSLSPQRGRVVPELKDHGILQYREQIITPWRIIYRVSDKDVYILTVIDSRQNVEDILLERLVNSTS